MPLRRRGGHAPIARFMIVIGNNETSLPSDGIKCGFRLCRGDGLDKRLEDQGTGLRWKVSLRAKADLSPSSSEEGLGWCWTVRMIAVRAMLAHRHHPRPLL